MPVMLCLGHSQAREPAVIINCDKIGASFQREQVSSHFLPCTAWQFIEVWHIWCLVLSTWGTDAAGLNRLSYVTWHSRPEYQHDEGMSLYPCALHAAFPWCLGIKMKGSQFSVLEKWYHLAQSAHLCRGNMVRLFVGKNPCPSTNPWWWSKKCT